MIHRLRSPTAWAISLAAIITLGLLSRLVHSGNVIFDKYLGDALYAAMVYAILRLLRPGAPVTLWAALIMLAIELFQLTLIPAHMLSNPQLAVRLFARLLGTEFSFLDLAAYAVGIACVRLADGTTHEEASGRRREMR